MKISVVIPVYNGEKTLQRCLEAVRQSEYSPDELIVVDDGSQDSSREIAKRYADSVIVHDLNSGPAEARNSGLVQSHGDVVVFIDADVVVKPQTLGLIAAYFAAHEDVAAVTGLLAKEAAYSNYFSRYKNLYMHYIFSLLPEQVTFLYGSIHAIARSALKPYCTLARIGEDTELGQQLVKRGCRITFMRDLEVVHLKEFRFWQFWRNEFSVPFHWTKIFMAYQGWNQVGRGGTGYAHAPKTQLVSIFIVGVFWLAMFGFCMGGLSAPPLISLLLIWGCLNYRFLRFLFREGGCLFGCLSAVVTFLDQSVMGIGITVGMAFSLPLLR